MPNKTVAVFGATGAIGTSFIEIAAKAEPNWKILAISRSGKSCRAPVAAAANVSTLKASVEDLEDCKRVAAEADVIVCCVGFAKYEAKYWAKHWPIVQGNLLAVTSSAKPLIFCDNLYAYGPTTDISSSSSSVAATSKTKPGVRAGMKKIFEERMKKDPNSLTVVGGSDFFGPHVTDVSVLGGTVISKIVQGQQALALGSADKIHDFCFTKDFGRAMFLATKFPEKAAGKFWICPHSIKGYTLKQLATKISGMVGKKDKGVSVLPGWAMYMLGFFLTMMAELYEMLPFWKNDYSVSGDQEFCETFNVEATPADQALQETIDYFQETVGKK